MPGFQDSNPAEVRTVVDALNHPDANALVESNRFLRDLRAQWVSGAWMSEAQVAAVGRILRENGWHLMANTWLSPAAEVPAVTAEETPLVPATCNDTTEIPNGIFTLTLTGSDASTYQIRTINQATNEDLIGKRVIAYKNERDTWVNFAYLTTLGRLKLWRRFDSRDGEPVVLYAKQLLSMLRQNNLAASRRTSVQCPDPIDAEQTWTMVVVSFNCRYCNAGLETIGTMRQGHDSCGRSRRFGVQDIDISRPPRSPRVEVRRTTPAAPREEQFSELGTGWLR